VLQQVQRGLCADGAAAGQLAQPDGRAEISAISAEAKNAFSRRSSRAKEIDNRSTSLP